MDNHKPRVRFAVDFAVPPDLVALTKEARDLGVAAAATRNRREHSWICGFDREFSKELGRRGWLGMTWPQELGGAGRSNFERFLVAEALIADGGADSGDLGGRSTDRSDARGPRFSRTAAPLPAGDD